MDWEREELARRSLEDANMGAPVDPFLLAARLDLTVMDGGPTCDGICFDQLNLILVNEEERHERCCFAVGHETGHFLQRRSGLSDTEAGANYLASALLLPRFEFEIDLKRYGWDLLAMKSRHRNASFEAIARRIVALRDARAFIFDKPLRGQARPSWYSVPWGLRPNEAERVAAQEAAQSGAPVEPIASVTGWPVIENDWIRVITVTAR